jgi:capsular exopolysaccharide synthesis family protein
MDHYLDRPDSLPSNVAIANRPRQLSPTYQGYEPVPLSNGYDSSEEPDSTNILQYWRMLARHKRLIAITSLAFMGLGYAVGLPMKPVYRAQAMLEILNVNEDFMDMKHSNPLSTSGDYSDDTSEEQTQARLLQSTALMNRVREVLSKGGNRASVTQDVHQFSFREMFHLAQKRQVNERETLISKTMATLKVRPTGRTRLLEVTAESTSPQFADEFLNTLTEQFIEQNLEARMNDTRRTGDWLRREIEDARTRLRASEDALQNYARQSGLIFTDDNTNVATEKLQQVQQELSEASADRIRKQSRFELAKDSPPDSLADVLNDPGLRDTGAKLKDLQRQIAELTAVYNPGYPKLKQLHAEQIALQAAFDHDREDILSRIRTDFQEAQRREKLLSGAYNVQVREVSGQGEKGIQYNILKREVDSNRQLYDSMLQQTKQASVASAMRASNIRVVDPAELPTAPVFPNYRMNSAIGLVLGLICSVAFVILRENVDRTIHDPGETQLLTSLPDLGTIPSATSESKKRTYGPLRGSPTLAVSSSPSQKSIQNDLEAIHHLDSAPAAIGLSRIGTDHSSLNPIAANKDLSFVAEAFRSVLTSILVAGDLAKGPQVLVLTSANAAEGKTTVVSNLAIAMAEIGRSVLIIDADMRRPRIHSLFNIENEHGLTNLLKMKQSPDKAAAEIISPTNIDGLYVLPSGPPTSAAANLLYSPNLAKLISGLKSQYDMILIDTPPMQMTDARVAARLADAVIIVARSGRTTRDALLAAAQRFKEDRIRVLGTILNDWNPKQSRGGYYYGGRYYGSASSYQNAKYYSAS